MRRKKFILNTFTALLNQFVMVVCAFILPRLILNTFGSETNGLVSSVQQFLAVISFMELGVGAVVQASLYKPLAEKNKEQVSKIIVSATKFFRKLAIIMLLYTMTLLVVYPVITHHEFSLEYVDTLILAMSISYFAQYYFGLRNQLLLIADQKGYIHYGLNTVSIIMNNLLGAFLITSGQSIQVVKLCTSLILLFRPVALEIYVRKHYELNYSIQYSDEPIAQKWNGVAQHIATVVLNSTDTIVLTLFSSFSNVSIYNVYYLVINGLNNLVISLTSGFQSMIGNMLSKKESKLISDVFSWYESLFHFAVTFIYGCVILLIVPFVLVYTKEVKDMNYNVPAFASLIAVANMMYCIRLPYNTIIKAAGHFKQTQNSAWIEMVINIVISVLVVSKYGLIGVAVGTLSAMTYRTLYLVNYLSNNIIFRKQYYFFKHLAIDAICIGCAIYFYNIFELTTLTFSSWIILALKKGIVYLLLCSVLNLFFFRKQIIGFNDKEI